MNFWEFFNEVLNCQAMTEQKTSDANLLRQAKMEGGSGKLPKPWSRQLTIDGIVTDAASVYVLCPRS